MCEPVRRRRSAGALPADAGRVARAVLVVVAGLQFAAVICLLWQAARAADVAGWWWAAAGIAMLAMSAVGWPAAWRGTRWRYAGMAAGATASEPAELWVARRGRARVRARVTAWWRVADVLTVLRLSDPLGLAPRLLVVPAGAARSLHRTLHRNTPSRR